MRAVLRGIAMLLAGVVWLTPAVALAQEAPPATSNTPATDAVGPRELQNFSLSGTVSKPADQPSAPTVTAAKPPPAPAQPVAATPIAVRQTPAAREPRRSPAAAAPAAQPSADVSSSTQAPAPAPPVATTSAATAQSFAPPSLPSAPTSGLAPGGGFPMLPWLPAALALAGVVAFLLWRRQRAALAGDPHIDLFVAPEPDPAPPPPAPEPVRALPPKPGAPAASGIVASRLRPSIELGVHPLRCLVEDGQVVIEFEVELYNAGTAPARAVLAEASLMNAGATQDKELISFFANPVGAGERLDAIPPMRRINLTSRVVAPRAAIQEYDVAGRKAFVPVIAFNALYEWSGGRAQTSVAYLVGRETRGEKLGPLHLDLGPRAFTSLGARELPAAVRT